MTFIQTQEYDASFHKSLSERKGQLVHYKMVKIREKVRINNYPRSRFMHFELYDRAAS